MSKVFEILLSIVAIIKDSLKDSRKMYLRGLEPEELGSMFYPLLITDIFLIIMGSRIATISPLAVLQLIVLLAINISCNGTGYELDFLLGGFRLFKQNLLSNMNNKKSSNKRKPSTRKRKQITQNNRNKDYLEDDEEDYYEDAYSLEGEYDNEDDSNQEDDTEDDTKPQYTKPAKLRTRNIINLDKSTDRFSKSQKPEKQEKSFKWTEDLDDIEDTSSTTSKDSTDKELDSDFIDISKEDLENSMLGGNIFESAYSDDDGYGDDEDNTNKD